MTMRERQRQVQLYRGQVPSPGRPTVAWREDRVQFWAAIGRGASSEDAALETGVSQAVGRPACGSAAGPEPAARRGPAGNVASPRLLVHRPDPGSQPGVLHGPVRRLAAARCVVGGPGDLQQLARPLDAAPLRLLRLGERVAVKAGQAHGRAVCVLRPPSLTARS
jgi:hypothetical protein